jgi:hypothetical protein
MLISLLKSPHSKRITILTFTGAFVVLAIICVAVLYEHSFFIPWKNLGKPVEFSLPGEKVDRILSVSTRSIRVGTNNGRAFETDLPWIKWGATPKDFPYQWNEVPYEILADSTAHFGCPYIFWEPPPPFLFGKIIDRVQVKGCRLYVGIEQADFVILKDGTVWVWEHQRFKGNE